MHIENTLYRIEVDETHGLISSIFLKRTQTELITEQRLADNFRLLVPVQECQANYLNGRTQILSSCEVTTQGAVLRWDGPLINNHGDAFPIAVRMAIELVGEGIHF